MSRTPSLMYSSLRSVSLRNVYYYFIGGVPILGNFPTNTRAYSTNDIGEFIKGCKTLEFLVLGEVPGDDDAIAIFSYAVEHRVHLSELYLGQSFEDYFIDGMKY